MFTENEKISGRQLFRVIVLALAGPTLLVCPRVAGQYGLYGVWVYAVAGGLSIGYVALMIWLRGILGRYDSGTLAGGGFWRFMDGALNVVLAGKLLILAIGALYLVCDVVTGILLPRTHIGLILLVLAIALVYWHQGSVECTARAFEMLFYWVLVPIVIVVVLAIPKVELSLLMGELEGSLAAVTRIGGANAKNIIFTGVLLWFLFAPAELLVVCGKHYRHDKKTTGYIWKGAATVLGGNVITYMVILGIYGHQGLIEGSPYPLLKMMQVGGIPGDFLRRVDGFMCVFLILSLFGAIVILIDYVGICLWRLKSGVGSSLQACRRTKWWFASIVTVVMATSVVVLKEQNIFREPAADGSPIDADKKLVSSVELEDRAFVMSVLIGKETITFEIASDEQDMWQTKSEYATLSCHTVEEAELLYKDSGDKQLDFTHMKLIFVAEDVDQSYVTDNLMYMYNQEKYAENILVCRLTGDLVKMAANAMENEEALAVWVENILEKSGKDKGMELYEVYGDY